MADSFAYDAFVYCNRHGELPSDTEAFCSEVAHEIGKGERYATSYRRYIESKFLIQKATAEAILCGACYVVPKPGADAEADIVNERLRDYFRLAPECRDVNGAAMRFDVYRGAANGEKP